jgi:hypothetical protein
VPPMPEAVEILKGEKVRVTTDEIQNGDQVWRITEIGPLEIRTEVVEMKTRVPLAIVSLLVLTVGYLVMGPFAFLIGGLIALLSVVFRPRQTIHRLVSIGPPEIVLLTHPTLSQVELMKKAVDVAKTMAAPT